MHHGLHMIKVKYFLSELEQPLLLLVTHSRAHIKQISPIMMTPVIWVNHDWLSSNCINPILINLIFCCERMGSFSNYVTQNFWTFPYCNPWHTHVRIHKRRQNPWYVHVRYAHALIRGLGYVNVQKTCVP